MMKKLIIIGLIITEMSLQAQIQKAETYIIGTKVNYYINQCGNVPTETLGKFTFCDANNNLGVVAESYGLNDNSIREMVPNYHNNDEVYITQEGLSIRHTNNTWENVPNYAIIPSSSNAVTFLSGMVIPSGKVLIQTSNSNWSFYVYDPAQKTMENVVIPTNKYPKKFIYDTNNQIALIFTGNSSNYDIYSYDGTQLNLLAANVDQTNNGVPNNLISNNRTAIYSNHKIYANLNTGLYVIDVNDWNNINTTHYDSSTTPALPFDNIRDLDIDNNGNIWFVSNNSNEGAISKFDITTNTIVNYQEVRPNGTDNLIFNDIAVKDDQTIWTITGNYHGLVNLDVSSGTASWQFTHHDDLVTAGLPYSTQPKNVQFFNQHFYFTFFNGNNSNQNYEVIINDNGVWNGRNDDELGNISRYMVNRFKFIHPDDIGGVWWFNESDNMVLHKDALGNFQSENLNFTYTGIIDADQKAVVRVSSQSLTKIDIPGIHDFPTPNNNGNYLNRIDNEIWSFSASQPRIDIIENEVVTNTYLMDETTYQHSYFHFAIDDNRNAWFAKVIGSTLRIKKFDTENLTTTTTNFNVTQNIGGIKKILAAPNNAIWIINEKAVFYIQNGTVTTFYSTDYSEINNIYDAIVDENGKLYFINFLAGSDSGGSLVSLENPITNPSFNKTTICGHNSHPPLFPEFVKHGITNLCIDSEGDIWVFAQGKGGFIKLIDNDTSVQYRHQPTLGITDLTGDVIQVKVYPNPVTQNLHISATKPLSYIALYNLRGKLIWQIKPEEEQQVDIATQQLTQGVYILKVISQKKQISKQIIKN